MFELGLAGEGRCEKEDYPNRPVQLIIPWSPGTSTDVIARLVAPQLGKYFGQPWVLVNKPGAGGVIGHTLIAKSKPDGYTLGAVSTLAGSYLLVYKDLEFDLDSFVPIAAFIKVPMFFLVKLDAPYRTLKDLVDDAKKNPGKLRYGTIGVASAQHLVADDFCNKAGINLTHVPYAGTADVLTALLGGHVDLAPTWGSLGHLKGGTVRALAVSEKERLEEYPDIPTLTELGYPIVIFPIQGQVAPKGTPKKIIDKLSKGYLEVANANKKVIAESGKKFEQVVNIIGPDEYSKRMREHFEYMYKTFKRLQSK